MDKKFKSLTLIDTFWYFMYGVAAPFITIFFNEFGSLDDVGLSVAILFIVQAFVSLFAGKVLNKIDNKLVLLIGKLFEAFRIFMFLFASNIYWVFALQFIGGITQGFIWPAGDQLFVKISKKVKGTSFGERTFYTNLAMGVSALIAGFLLTLMGYAPMFIIWGISEAIYGIFIYLKL